MRSFLHFHLREQHRRRHCRHGHAPTLCAANTVEYVLLIARRHNPRQRRQRRPHNVHAAHQLIRPPIRINSIHDHRQHLKGLRQRPRRQRESALNIIEIQSVWLALLLHFIDQLLPHLRFRHRFRRRNQQIPLASRWHQPRLIPPVPVRSLKSRDRHPRRQKTLQYAILNNFHALRRRPFVVVLIKSRQLRPFQLAQRRIIRHAQKFRQHQLIHLLGERLSLIFIALPMTFHAMPQNFVKENRRRSPAQQRRPVVRLRHRSLPQILKVRRHLLDLRRQLRLVRPPARRRSLKRFDAQPLHPIIRASRRLHHHARRRARRRDHRPFARHQPRICRRHLQRHRSRIHFRVFPKRARQSPYLAFPRCPIESRHRQRLARVRRRSLLRKIRRLILFFRSHRCVRLHIQKRRRGTLVFAVRQLPQNPANRIRIIAQRQRARSHSARSTLPVRIVQRWRTHAHHDIRLPSLQSRICQQTPIRPNQKKHVLIVHGVTDVVGRRITLRQSRRRACQFRLHHLQNRVRHLRRRAAWLRISRSYSPRRHQWRPSQLRG